MPDADVALDAVAFIDATPLPGCEELELAPVSTALGLSALDPATPLPGAATVRYTRWSPVLD